MNKKIAQLLAEKAQEVAGKFSNPERAFNALKETFMVERIVPLSEFTAAATFVKSGGKKSLAVFFWISAANADGGYWMYFFPRESHVFGLEKLRPLLQEIEEFNFPLNFETARLEAFL